MSILSDFVFIRLFFPFLVGRHSCQISWSTHCCTSTHPSSFPRSSFSLLFLCLPLSRDFIYFLFSPSPCRPHRPRQQTHQQNKSIKHDTIINLHTHAHPLLLASRSQKKIKRRMPQLIISLSLFPTTWQLPKRTIRSSSQPRIIITPQHQPFLPPLSLPISSSTSLSLPFSSLFFSLLLTFFSKTITLFTFPHPFPSRSVSLPLLRSLYRSLNSYISFPPIFLPLSFPLQLTIFRLLL